MDDDAGDELAELYAEDFHNLKDTFPNIARRSTFLAIYATFEHSLLRCSWRVQRLASQRYLAGDAITEADWRLFTTLIRFDAVYHGHFKCNRQKLNEFHNISNYLRELYQVAGVKETVDLDYTKIHYYASHTSINPTQVVPLGPQQNFDGPHDREDL